MTKLDVGRCFNLVAWYKGSLLLRLHHEGLFTIANEERPPGLLKDNYAMHSNPPAGDFLGRESQQICGMAYGQLR